MCQKPQLTLPKFDWLTLPTTQSVHNRYEVATDIQTGEQCFSKGSINAQKYLVTTLKTLIVFPKIKTLLETEAAKVNFVSRMTPIIFNSKTIISSAVLSMTKTGNKDATIREREIITPPSSYLDSSTATYTDQSPIIT